MTRDDGLTEAMKQISEVAEHINEHIKQQDNFMKMLAIQRSLTGHSAPRILVPGRVFIKDGPLKKVPCVLIGFYATCIIKYFLTNQFCIIQVSKRGGRSRERMFFLFSDMLMYAKPKWIENTSLGGYSCCCIMPLHHCRVSRVFGHGQGVGALFSVSLPSLSSIVYTPAICDKQFSVIWFQVVCKDESLLLFSDHKTVDSWIEALQNAIR